MEIIRLLGKLFRLKMQKKQEKKADDCCPYMKDIIILDLDDDWLVQRLKWKLEEYQERPESLDKIYKIEILDYLLRDEVGMVEYQDVYKKVCIDYWCFYNAFTVIKSYVENEGICVKGGTGLPTKKVI